MAPAPFTVQVTAVLDVPVTVAENCCVPPATREAAVGEMDIETVEVPADTALVLQPVRKNREKRRAAQEIGTGQRNFILFRFLLSNKKQLSNQQSYSLGLPEIIANDFSGSYKGIPLNQESAGIEANGW